MIRLSRGCYDKFHRCPGWIGGGPKYAKVKRCKDGRIEVDYDNRWWAWKFWPCDTCNVLVWPYHTRKLSLPWWKFELTYRYEGWRNDREWRRRGRP